MELHSGKAFNPCPPGWQKHFDVFRDIHNIREQWARPDDPTRARLFTPEQADLNRARLLRWDKKLKQDERSAAKEAINEFIRTGIEQGQIANRQDVVKALQEAGLKLNRAGKDYISPFKTQITPAQASFCLSLRQISRSLSVMYVYIHSLKARSSSLI